MGRAVELRTSVSLRCGIVTSLVIVLLALSAAQADAQRIEPKFDPAGRRVGEKVYDARDRLVRETTLKYRNGGQKESESTVEYGDDGSRTEVVIRYALPSPHSTPAGARKPAPEIASETVAEYTPVGLPASRSRTEYRLGKRNRTVEFQYEAGNLSEEHTTIYRPDGVRVAQEYFDNFFPGSQPPLLKTRVQTVQDDRGRTVLISREEYAKTARLPRKPIAGTRQTFEYESAEATQPARQITSHYNPRTDKWEPRAPRLRPMADGDRLTLLMRTRASLPA